MDAGWGEAKVHDKLLGMTQTFVSEQQKRDDLPLWRQVISLFAWTRDSSILLSVFFLTVALILYVWWPLAVEATKYLDWSGPWWRYMDWLLVGIFLFMSIAIVSRANLRVDALTIAVATVGGLVIESWGTQTNLWFYYTAERPPLWIIPAWPIATLTINRIVLVLDIVFKKGSSQPLSGGLSSSECREGRIEARSRRATFTENTILRLRSLLFTPLRNWSILKTAYWTLFTAFVALMLYFVAPTFNKSYTILSILLVALLILTPTDHRVAILTFIAGSALGYFLELWGTTRECWTYYTFAKPPIFAVFAHGMAAVAFWRTELLVKTIWQKITLVSGTSLERERS